MEKYQHEQVQRELDRRLAFIDFARVHFISAFFGFFLCTTLGMDVYFFVSGN